MNSISNLIEEFLIETLGDGDTVNISRNELALYFDCAPSQINYVLSTRFSLERGFIIESRRGGGGSITLIRVASDAPGIMAYLDSIRDGKEGIGYVRAAQLLRRMAEDGLITARDGFIIGAAITDKALLSPAGNKDILRANVLDHVLRTLLKAADIK